MERFNKKLASLFAVTLMTVAALGASVPLPTLALAPGNTALGAYTCRYYIVRRGDTLTRLSNLFDVSIKTIMQVNRLRSTRILIGRRLCIPVYKAPSPVPTPSGPWYGEYWNNTAQSGAPSLVRNDAAVNFNWGFGTPDPARIFSDNFSARWTRSMTFVGGAYRFALTADDGIRLVIDGNVVLDRYGYVGNQTNQVDVPISSGVHTVRIDYVEQAGLALARVTFFRVGGTVPGPQPCASACPPAQMNGPWSAQFFNNINLDGAPVFVATYNGVRFNWGYGSPSSLVPADNFSGRFTQYRYFPAGVYRFVARADDGVRVFVDDRPVINQWVQQSARTVTGDISLGAGSHLVRIEYFDLSALAELSVYWEFLGNP